MLESIRKYQWLMVAVFILLAAGFLFTMNDVNARSGGNETVLKINGQGYDQGDVRRNGSQASSLAQYLGLFDLLGSLGGDFNDPDPVLFFTNRLVLREAGRELGLTPGDDELVAAVRQLFTNPETNEFDRAKYAEFETEILTNRYNSNANDLLYPLISDNLIMQRIAPLITGDFAYEPTISRALFDSFTQRATVELFAWDLESFQNDLSPTDEELEEYWSDRRANYGSEPLYSLHYVVATPDYPAAPAAVEGEDEAAAKEAQEPARKAAEREIIGKMNDLWQQIDLSAAKDFDSLAASAGLEVQTVEAVAYDNLPAPFLTPKSGTRGGTGAADVATRAKLNIEGSAALGDVFTTRSNETVIYKITAFQPSEPLEFAQAKDDVLEDYKRDKATELLIAAVSEKREALASELESGASLTEATEKLGLDSKRLENVSSNAFIEGEFATPQIAEAARATNPGALTEIIGSETQLAPGNRAMFAYVENRTVENLPNREELINNTSARQNNGLRSLLFFSWLAEKRVEAQIESRFAEN